MIIATAGHVDHGKTLLVRALTGVDTDRLPEEKKRGLTIDLGFAYLPIDGETIGFIDVPGHERFVHNMLCGVAGIDAVLFIVAADDGPMPQTIEHMAILDLLGIRHGLVALTKIDRVAPERVVEVTGEIEGMLARTSLANAPIFPVSAVSGDGIGGLKEHLRELAKQVPARSSNGNFRLAVDRVFTIAGAGLIVTGTVVSGRLRVGEEVRGLHAQVAARVRSIHAQNAPSEVGQAGQRCALNLTGTEVRNELFQRGEWIVTGGVPAPVAKFDARIRVLASEGKALANWTPVHVHLGASDVTGRIAILEGPSIAPGAAGLVQLVLDRPIGAVHGDRFIVRDQSAQRTVAGGVVIDVFPPTRGRSKPERLDYLRAMEAADHANALAALLDWAGSGLDLVRFATNRNLTQAEATSLVARVSMRRVGTAGAIGFSAAHWDRLRAAALDVVAAAHKKAPDAVGIGEDRILDGTRLRLTREIVTAIAAELVREGALLKTGLNVHLPSHRAQFASADAALWTKIVALLEAGAARPPLGREIAEQLRTDPKKVLSVLDRATRQGHIVRISGDRYFLPATVRQLAEIAEAVAKSTPNGKMIAAQFRDKSGLGRNLSIEVLEFFDRVKFTRRVGDAREVLRKPSDAFP